MPTPEQHVAGDLFEALNAHDLDRLGRIVAPEYVGADVSRDCVCRNAGEARAELAGWLGAFPDLRIVVDDVVVEAPRVTVRWTLRGTHEGHFLNVPPTRRHIALGGFSLLTVERGRVVRGVHLWDMAAMLRGMRLLPELPASLPHA